MRRATHHVWVTVCSGSSLQQGHGTDFFPCRQRYGSVNPLDLSTVIILRDTNTLLTLRCPEQAFWPSPSSTARGLRGSLGSQQLAHTLWAAPSPWRMHQAGSSKAVHFPATSYLRIWKHLKEFCFIASHSSKRLINIISEMRNGVSEQPREFTYITSQVSDRAYLPILSPP